MCRVFMCNKKFFEENGKVLPKLWNRFVSTNGGDGNGVACYVGRDYIPLVEKGVKQTVWQSYDACKKWARLDECKWLMFHTRMATSGGIRDEMCHPFIEDGDILLHNGVCSEFAGFQIDGEDVSDTRMLFYLARNYSANFYETIYNGSGAFLGVYMDRAYAIKASHSAALVCLYNEKTGGMAWCSTWSLSIPDGYKIYDTRSGIWIEGVDIIGEKASKIIDRETGRTLPGYLSAYEYDELLPVEQASYYLCESKNKDGKIHQYYQLKTNWTSYSSSSSAISKGWSSQAYWDDVWNQKLKDEKGE